MIAEDLFGPSASGLKGKTATTSTEHIREEIIPFPDEILDNYKDICLGVDILFINEIPFLTTISRHFYFITVEAILNVEAKTLLKSLKGAFTHYHKRGSNIKILKADNQSDCLIDHLAELHIQMTSLAKGEHEKFVERNIRFIKEQCHCSF